VGEALGGAVNDAVGEVVEDGGLETNEYLATSDWMQMTYVDEPVDLAEQPDGFS
jgi:hypothetical protein